MPGALADFTRFEMTPGNRYGAIMDRLIAGYVEDARQGDYIVGMVDLNTLFDGLSSLIGPEALCYALIDEEDEVLRVLNAHLDFFEGVYRRYLAMSTQYQGGTSNWLGIYSDEPWYYISNDFMVMLSPEHMQRFVAGPLERMARMVGRNLFHLDGETMVHHLDGLLALEALDGIQVQATPAMQSAAFWLPYLQRIQAAGKRCWIEARDVDEVRLLIERLRPEGLFIKTWAGSEAEGRAICELVQTHYGLPRSDGF